MKTSLNTHGMLALFLFLCIGCQSGVTVETRLEDGTFVEEEEIIDDDGNKQEAIFIIDRTGKKWEVTHAVNKYDFDRHGFQFGLGPNAIPPILNPEFIEPGESGYPDVNETFLVMGVNLDEDPRAYPISIMSSHEVVDENIEDAFVAVAY